MNNKVTKGNCNQRYKFIALSFLEDILICLFEWITNGWTKWVDDISYDVFVFFVKSRFFSTSYFISYFVVNVWGMDGIVGCLASHEACCLWVGYHFQVIIYTHEDKVIWRWRASPTGIRTQYHPVKGATMLLTELTRPAGSCSWEVMLSG